MRRLTTRTIGLVTGLCSMLMLSACAGTQAQNTQAENTQETSQSETSAQSTQAQKQRTEASETEQGESAARQIQKAAKATVRETAEAADVVGRTITGTKSAEDQEKARKQRERNARQVGIGDSEPDMSAGEPDKGDSETDVGGGPVDSETLATLDSIDKDTKDYKERVDKAGDKISPTTQLRFEQVQDEAKGLRKQYDAMKKESDMDISALDKEYNPRAEQLKESWDHVSQNLRRELDNAASEEDE